MKRKTAPTTVRVDVDTQNGFCDPKGALYVKGAEAAIPNVARLNRDAAERGIALVGSVDTHDYASPEFRENGGPWPRHCVKGTWDWLKVEATLVPRFRILPKEAADVATAFDGGRAALYLEKDAYSLFDNPNAPALLALLRACAGGGSGPLTPTLSPPRAPSRAAAGSAGCGPPAGGPGASPGRRGSGGAGGLLRFEVYGVATDYCVRAAALGLKKGDPGCEVALVADACAGVTSDTTAAALRELEAAGVRLISTDEALRPGA